MKIKLLENENTNECVNIEFDSEIIFNNGDKIFINDTVVILSNRCYDISKCLKRVESVTYNFKEN